MEKKYNIYQNFDDKALRKLSSLLSVKTMEYKPNQTIDEFKDDIIKLLIS